MHVLNQADMMSQIYHFRLTDVPNLIYLGVVLWPTRTAFIQQTDCPLPAITMAKPQWFWEQRLNTREMTSDLLMVVLCAFITLTGLLTA